MSPVSPRRFAWFRLLLGAWLLFFLAPLLPFATELFGRDGVLPVAPYQPGFPNLLGRIDAAPGPTLFVAALCVLATCFAAGVGRAACAVGLWYGLACLTGRNPGIANPALPFVGWLLLATALVPAGESLRAATPAAREGFRLPRFLYGGAWWITALAYTVSGFDKLASPRWLDGSAVPLVAGLPFARPHALAEAIAAAPDALAGALTASALAAELLFAPLAAVRRLRPLAWLAGAGLQLGLLVVMDFPEISLAMLLVHLFLFDERWWVRGAPRDQRGAGSARR